MPVLHSAKPPREPWNRSHRLAVGSVTVGVLGVISALIFNLVKGDSQPSSMPASAGPTTIECYQFCGGTVPGSQEPQAAAESEGSKSCTDDPNNTSVRGGWGPARNVLSDTQFSEFPAFNIDNIPGSDWGDERGFYVGREFGTPPPNVWHYEVKVERDTTYIMRILIHNSAPSTVLATNTRLMVNLPTCTGRRIASQAYISSDNAVPEQVWGGVTFLSDERFNLAYVDGSAVLCTRHFVCDGTETDNGGATISEDFLTSRGVLLGSESLNGEVPGNYENSLLMMYKVRPQFASR